MRHYLGFDMFGHRANYYRDTPCRGCGVVMPDSSPSSKKCRDCLIANESRLRALRRASPLTAELRRLVIERDGGICQLCLQATSPSTNRYGHDLAPHIDHIRPISRGGKSALSNLRLLCRRCNLRKGSR